MTFRLWINLFSSSLTFGSFGQTRWLDAPKDLVHGDWNLLFRMSRNLLQPLGWFETANMF